MNMYSQEVKSFHDFNMTSIEGTSISLAEFTGKYVLVVNTASRCGYTKQYAELQELYELNGVLSHKIKWNFNKFLISPNGQILKAFGSSVKPLSREIVSMLN